MTGSRRVDLYIGVLRAKNGTPQGQLTQGVNNIVAKFTNKNTGIVDWSKLEAITKGGAIQSKANSLLRSDPVTQPLILQNRLLLDRGSALGLTSKKGRLLRPDYQLQVGNQSEGKWAIIDITTVGEARKVRNYDHRKSPFLIEVLY